MNIEEAINIPDPEAKTVVKSDESSLPKIFVVAKSRHYGHELSFEKYSNQGWHN